MNRTRCLLLCIIFVVFWSCGSKENNEVFGTFQLNGIEINGISQNASYTEVDPNLHVTLTFSEEIDQSTLQKNITLQRLSAGPITLTYVIQGKTIVLQSSEKLDIYTDYQLIINTGLKSTTGNRIQTGKVYYISTGLDHSDKFPHIADEELLTLVQRQTFRYFWDFGHPVSGMARERSSSGDIVTTGGTGFGIMAMIVAIERQFIDRGAAVSRLLKITRFLKNNATPYHGAFAHWINGTTGRTQPFSEKDNGADLVETSFLFQGLLTARHYFRGENPDEKELRELITELWEAVEWSWFRRNNEEVLYWHWSPDYGWDMNHKIRGWNESLITYVLAASSPTFPIGKPVYDNGWADKGNMRNNGVYYDFKLPLGPSYGGPLFFAHYSFLGLNPWNLKDQYADYWQQNVHHAKINHAYCKLNPAQNRGYSAVCWGLTASDGNSGYSAHSPTNDKGVIAPTAALSSMPYTPEESMAALHFFYYKLGDKLWKQQGFIDAFNLSVGWYANDFLAIDQGPIIVMIENHRSGLLWNIFMDIPEIKTGLTKLGFSY
ncbi:MAG: beta-glucosidase [Bacteroidetes bacterium GWD2_45_23]|nr:MAG: beta-glucosidase [Bacteroidetes bacterium GWC2_46_850]OFX86330.1 MAG: beta-glucosidase [Bacteroidetes bacterium GWD2_45_23]